MRQRIVQLARHAIPLAADRELLGRRGLGRQLLIRNRERCLLLALLLQQPADAHSHKRHCAQSGNREDKEQRIEHSAGTVEWEAQRKINELQQQKKDKEQRFILSPEQTAELAKLRTEEAESRKRLKQVQKDFRKEIVSLQTTVKWMNILAVPAAVTASGIVIAVAKRRKTSAK